MNLLLSIKFLIGSMKALSPQLTFYLPCLLMYKLMFTRLKIKSYEFLEMQPVSQPTEQNSVHLQKQQILNWSFPPFLEFWMRPGSFYIGIVKNVC